MIAMESQKPKMGYKNGHYTEISDTSEKFYIKYPGKNFDPDDVSLSFLADELKKEKIRLQKEKKDEINKLV